jgi:hypothetical protein
MSSATYELIDEPRPGALSKLAVKPLWPLLAVMLGGAWISWPWFVLNGFAVGSPTRRRELAWAIAGVAGSFALLVGISFLLGAKVVGGLGFRYLLIGVVVYKLYVSYLLYSLQSRSFGLFEHFGGETKSGLFPLIAAALLRPRLLEVLPGFLQVLLG